MITIEATIPPKNWYDTLLPNVNVNLNVKQKEKGERKRQSLYCHEESSSWRKKENRKSTQKGFIKLFG